MTDSEKEKARVLISDASAAFQAGLQQALAALRAGSLLSAAVWAQVSADLAFHKHPGVFCSPELEEMLLEIAGQLETGGAPAPQGFTPKVPGNGKPRMLHVLTNAYATGGHSRLVQRLAANSGGKYRHFLVTTAQRGDLPERLKRVFCAEGCNWLDLSTPRSDLLSRSLRLREISRQDADVVVLHCHPFDVVPALAFGIPGGPPVIIVNHSDHTFWVGASVADAVADIRLIGQELTLSRRQGAVSRVLPIPLADGKHAVQDRSAARGRLGIAEDAVVLLTIASPYKYTPLGGYDFIATVTGVLQRHEKAVLLACGPRDAGAWKEASERVGGRIRPCGVQADLSDFHAAADIYLDPFPYASLTSMLETALHAVPVVGMANSCAPTFTDGSIIAGDGWTHASSGEDYQQRIDALIADPKLRAAEGGRLREQVVTRHLMPEWESFLDELMKAVPASHAVRSLEKQLQKMDETDYFLAMMAQVTSGRHSVNTSLRKHGGCFPAKERCRLFLKALVGADGMRLLPLSTYRGKELFS